MRVVHAVVGGVVAASTTSLVPASCAPPPAALPCAVSVSSYAPPQRSTELVTVVTSPGAAVAATAHFAAGTSSQAGRASAGGRLVLVYPVGTAPVGRPVTVTVHVALGSRDARCATSFDPAPGPPTAGPVPVFGPARTLLTGTGGDVSVDVGDVSGDGRADLVAASPASDATTPGRVLVYQQGLHGSLLAPYTLPDDATYAAGPRLAIADVTGDGKADLLLAASSTLDLYTQQAGRLTGPVRLAIPADDVHVADVNRDGFPDLLVISQGQVRLYLGNARHTYTGYTTIGGPLDQGFRALVTLGDVDGDGRLDVVASTDHGFWVSRQDATGHFAVPQDYLLPPDAPGAPGGLPYTSGLAVGDVTGDGHADVVASNGENQPGRVYVYPQHAGALAAPQVYGSSDVPDYLAVVDANGDRRNDVVVYHEGWDNVGIYDQNLTGGLDAESSYPLSTAQFDQQAFALADLTSDGRPDLVGVGADSRNRTVLEIRDQLPPAP